MLGKLLLIILLVAGIAGGYFYIKTHSSNLLSMAPQILFQKKDVKGATTSNKPTILQDNIAQIQKQISKLSLKDVTGSSPQVKAILQSIQSLPAGEVHDICQKLCGESVQ